MLMGGWGDRKQYVSESPGGWPVPWGSQMSGVSPHEGPAASHIVQTNIHMCVHGEPVPNDKHGCDKFEELQSRGGQR